jgi:hypothetical protein
MNDVQRKRYFDLAMDAHEMQRQSVAMTSALQSLYTQLNAAKSKIDAGPADVKAASAAFMKDFDAVRVKFGVPQPAPGAGGGGRGGGAPLDPANVAGRVAAAKSSLLAFAETPSGSVMAQYTDVKSALPKAMAEGNAVIAKASALATTLKKVDVTLNVPASIK